MLCASAFEICAKRVGEIDPTCRFTLIGAQCKTLCTGEVKCRFVGETDCANLWVLVHLYFVQKGLVKLTPGVNFTNILQAAFSYKILLSSFFVLTA